MWRCPKAINFLSVTMTITIYRLFSLKVIIIGYSSFYSSNRRECHYLLQRLTSLFQTFSRLLFSTSVNQEQFHLALHLFSLLRYVLYYSFWIVSSNIIFVFHADFSCTGIFIRVVRQVLVNCSLYGMGRAKWEIMRIRIKQVGCTLCFILRCIEDWVQAQESTFYLTGRLYICLEEN